MKNKKIQNPVRNQARTGPASAPVNPPPPPADHLAVRAYYINPNNAAVDEHDEEKWLQTEAALKSGARFA